MRPPRPTKPYQSRLPVRRLFHLEPRVFRDLTSISILSIYLIVMFEWLLGHARRIRHVLDAWLMLALCPLFALIPWIGLPLGGLCGLGGVVASFRVMKEGRFRHGLLLVGLFSAALLFIPFLRQTVRASPLFPALAFDPPHAPVIQSPQALPSSMSCLNFAPEDLASLSPSAPLLYPPTPETTLAASIPPSHPDHVTEPRGEPADVGIEPRSNQAIRNFPREVEALIHSWWKARQSGDLQKAAELHADPVNLGGKLLSHDQLNVYIAEEWKTNAQVRQFSISPFKAFGESGQWTAQCHMRFSVAPPGNNFPVRGQCLHTFIIRDDNNALRIVEYRKTILPTIRSSTVVNGMRNVSLRTMASSGLEADVVGDIDTSMRMYASTVRYFGKTQTAAQIRTDKLRYFEKWPRRVEHFEGEFRLKERPHNQIETIFCSRFRTENDQRGEWCEGLVEHHFIFALSGTRPVIVEQSATILESRKGIL